MPSPYNDEQKARFAALAPVGAPDACWLWQGTKNAKGYGQFRLTSGLRPKLQTASRVAWAIANDRAFPENLFACHTCDTAPCVNPAHIWAGTPAQNTADMIVKGRKAGAGTYCINGHEFTPETTGRAAKGCRICLTCYRIRRGIKIRVSPDFAGAVSLLGALQKHDLHALRDHLNAQVSA